MIKINDLLKDMKDAIGNKEPVDFFGSMVDMFVMLFNKLDDIDKSLQRVKLQSALAIQWEPKVAADMLAKQVDLLRKDKDTYFVEITALKTAFAENKVTQNYQDFCKFWTDTLGWHPFLD